MKLANATNLDRKSGVAQRRDLQFHFRVQADVPWANRLRIPFFHQRKQQVPRCATPDYCRGRRCTRRSQSSGNGISSGNFFV
jgi:hypothetical protein